MTKNSALTNLELNPSDANVMIRFVGELNENLKFVEKTFDVKIFQNGNSLKIQGAENDVVLSTDALKRLYEEANNGIEITNETLNLCIQEIDDESINQEINIRTPKKSIILRGKNQKSYINNKNYNWNNYEIKKNHFFLK